MDAGRVGGGGGVALAAAATADSGSSNSSSGVNAVSREALGALLSGLVDAVPERGRTLQVGFLVGGTPPRLRGGECTNPSSHQDTLAIADQTPG